MKVFISLLYAILFVAVSVYSYTTFGIERGGIKSPSREVQHARVEKGEISLPDIFSQDIYCRNKTVGRDICLRNNIEIIKKLNNFLNANIVSKLNFIYDLVCPLSDVLVVGLDCGLGSRYFETEDEMIRILEEEMACYISEFKELMTKGFLLRIVEMKECHERIGECDRNNKNRKYAHIADLVDYLEKQKVCYERNLELMTKYSNELNRIATSLARRDYMPRRERVEIPPLPELEKCFFPAPHLVADELCN